MVESPLSSPSWIEIDRLVAEGKVQQALDLVETQIGESRDSAQPEAWTHALIKAVQLRTGLHGYEKAVRLLREETWPDAQPYRAIVGLFYAETLVHYIRVYGWEVSQREQIVSSVDGAELDLKQWTREQIYTEVQRAFAEVWAMRHQWGDASLGLLAPYVEQNDFPARIRGTLRDTVTYLWTQLLSDTSLWPVGGEDAVFTLDRDALIGGHPSATESPGADETNLPHPLARMAQILGDLETWHQQSDRPEAALEARRERLTRLRPHLNRSEDQSALIQDLRNALDSLGRRFPWWSMGMASLAEMKRDNPAADALASALETAKEGAQAHPGSAGATRCIHLAGSLEAPGYQLTAMAVDGPNRRSLEIRHKNLGAMHFRAYRIDLDQRLGLPLRGGLLPSQQELPALIRGTKPDAEWTATLPPTPDLRLHRTFITPPLEDLGLFVIVSSPRADFRQGDNDLQAVVLQRSDLVLLTRSDENRHEVTVRSGAHGTPIQGAEVALVELDYRTGINRTVTTERTDEQGRAQLVLTAGRQAQHILLARHGEDRVLGDQRLSTYRPAKARESTTSLVYTDRSIYRPGQDVHWKIVAYRRPAATDPVATVGRFTPLADRELDVVFRDANGQEVGRATVDTNAFGSASGTFSIPRGRALGQWNIATDLGGRAQVAVEEYKRPTFEVEIDDPASPLRLNRPATLQGHARYYFGLPVTSGTVQWRVTREPQWPPWWRGPWWQPRPSSAPQTVATGTSSLGAEGTFEVSFIPTADERLASTTGTTYRYRLQAEVTDDGGETRSGNRAYRLGFVAVEATVAQEPGFFTTSGLVELTVRRTDLDGVGRGGDGDWELIELEQPNATALPAAQPLPASAESPQDVGYQTAGDQQRPRWSPGYDPAQILRTWPDGHRVAHGTLGANDHDQDGIAALTFGNLAGGVYRLRYRTKDVFGAELDTSHELIVVAEGTSIALPSLLEVERTQTAAGQDANILVHSGLEDQSLLLEVLRGNTVIRRDRLRSKGSVHLVSMPITEADRGGLEVRLTGVRDHQMMSLSKHIAVPWDNRALTIEMASFRDHLRPGTEETWAITVRGAEGPLAVGAAELLAYMYDKSLDLFAHHQPPSLGNLTPTRGRGRPLHANLGLAPRIWNANRGFGSVPNDKIFQRDRLIFLDGWSIGGPGRGPGGVRMMATESMSQAAPMAPGGAVAKRRSAPAPGTIGAESVAVFAETAADDGAGSRDIDTASADDQAPDLRTDFAETAFWEPHLISDADGAVRFSFTVPDAVTEWNVWVHAVTRDLRASALRRQTRTVKELLVRPYVPRFLREGDTATIEVVINNAGEAPFTGILDFEILDPEGERSRSADFGLAEGATQAPFSVTVGGSTTIGFPIVVPAGVGTIAFRVVGRAGGWSDGELRPLPVLPGRFHLAQSRFAALRGADTESGTRTLRFDDLAQSDDPSRIDDRLVVTIDGQLFYSVLNALPYLVDYPYPSTEATLNRFVTTGILSRLFDDVPAVARMAAQLAERDTHLAPFDDDDANRTMALEETPWLRQAQGNTQRQTPDRALIRVLDPRVAKATRDTALTSLRRDRNADGGYPWFPGGPSSPWATSYAAYSFGKAIEMGVDVPQDLVVDAWRFLERHYRNDLERSLDETTSKDRPDAVRPRTLRWPTITFLNYILSMYPDPQWTGGVFSADDRTAMLARSFARWREHSPLLKGYLALTLARAGRGEDARLVFDSVLDSATTSEELGTYWAPEDRAWLWYNDTVEGHAFALRTLSELAPKDPRRDGLVHWLLLNKQLNHWQSTRTTAEVIYALTHHLKQAGLLGSQEAASVSIGHQQTRFVFDPDEYTGANNQVVIDGPDLDPATMAEVTIEQETQGLMFASATWHFSTETLPEESRGDFFAIERQYFRRVNEGGGFVLRPLDDDTVLAPGDQVEVQISIRAKHAAEYVHLRDPRAAGFEPESHRSGWRWDLGIGWYEEIRDSGTNFFFEHLPVGEYTFKYRLRANLAGSFKTAPAIIQSVYAPEFVAYSAGRTLTIEPGPG